MSLILEALKKSERQRRLGEMPNLGTPVLGARRRRSLLPWLGGAIVVALALGAWLRFAPPAQTPTTADADARTQVAAPPQAPSAAPPAPVAPAAEAPVAAAPAKPAPKRDLRLPSGDDRPGSVADLPVSSLVAGPRKPPAATPAAAPPATPAGAAKPPAPNADVAAKPARPAGPAVAKVAPAPSGAAAAGTAVAKAKTAPAAPRKPAVPALPSIWEMPYAVRKDLPALALTMHVYSSVPADRFVVLAGERHVEGDDLGEGVMLQEIRSDGIVLDFKGKRFVYPRDGR